MGILNPQKHTIFLGLSHCFQDLKFYSFSITTLSFNPCYLFQYFISLVFRNKQPINVNFENNKIVVDYFFNFILAHCGQLFGSRQLFLRTSVLALASCPVYSILKVSDILFLQIKSPLSGAMFQCFYLKYFLTSSKLSLRNFASMTGARLCRRRSSNTLVGEVNTSVFSQSER